MEVLAKENNALEVFSYKNQQVRTVEHNGEVWFVAKDVAQALGYKRTADAVAAHVDNEDKGLGNLPTPGGNQDITIINESGVYALIFASKLPTAKQFKNWVTHEVLPQIRRTGMVLIR